MTTDIGETRSRIHGYRLPGGILIRAAISRRADGRDLPELAVLQPAREIELFAVLAVGVDANVLRTFRAKQMHGVRDHHGALVEMVFATAIGFADTVWWGRKRRYQILEIQSPPLTRIGREI